VRNFFDQSRSDLLAWAESPARAARIFNAVYRQGAARFEDMAVIPPAIRAALAASLRIDAPQGRQRFDSADGTRRYLVGLADGDTVESVYIPSGDRVTACISSQIGCALGCAFCLTAQLGLIRDLSAGEIVAQALMLYRESIETPNRDAHFNVVLMGMGEPLRNYENVMKAIRILGDAHGLALPPSRITLSTAGLIPELRRLAAEPVFPNLSISLTGVTNATRDVLMPINRKYPVEDVMQFVRELSPARQRRVMLECVMIKDHTDTAEDAHALARLVEGMRVKVNLIPLNQAEEIPFQPAGADAILRFQEILMRRGIATFIRKTRGADVWAACGQLKNFKSTA
jgi:23S rRNA (adenine2503-C2)-methyltransferase